jgi:hypothetical protein
LPVNWSTRHINIEERGLDLFGPEYGAVMGSYEHGNEMQVSIWLTVHKLLKADSALWS